MKRAFIEFRLWIVSWLSLAIIYVAPLNTLEGQDVVQALHGYAKRAIERAAMRRGMKKYRERRVDRG